MDWLAATLPYAGLNGLADFLGEVLGSTWLPGRGSYGYARSLRANGEALILFSPGRPDIHASLPGAACRTLSKSAVRRILRSFMDADANWTRCDLAGTDLSRIVEPEEVAAAIDRREHVTHARRFGCYHGLADCPGVTVYIGAKSSRQQLLVYDKEAESNGRIRGVRWELRARDEAAASLVRQLLEHDDWGAVWAGRVVAFVDFRDRRAGREPQRCPRVAWFERLVGSSRRVRAYAPAAQDTGDVNMSWLERQVAPSLARPAERWVPAPK